MISKAVQRSPPKVTAAAIDHKLINAIIQAEIAHKNTPCQLDRNTQQTGSVRCYEFNDRLLCGGEFHSAFSLFVASAPYFPIPQSIEPPTFSPHYALLLAQGKAVGDHGDEFGIGRLALDVRHGVAEELLQNLDVAAIPRHLDSMPDRPLYA